MKTQKVTIKLNDKYARDADKKVILEKNAEGKEVKKVEKVGATYILDVSTPELSDFTQEQLQKFLDGAVDSYVRAAVRIADNEGATISQLSLSVDDVIGERAEISDELVEAVQESFSEMLAKAGKSEKAQKNNAALLVANVTTLAKTDPAHIAAFSKNVENFCAGLQPEKLAEFLPLMERTQKRLEKANAARADLF